jgi:flagellar hook protein FlgE
MPSFSTSLSGLNAEEQALSVISNNLANLNTTAYKAGTPLFSDLFYQLLGTTGSGDPVQVGVGATMSSVASPFTQGNIESTGVPTDAAIQGGGFFVLSQNGTQVYTRAGNFTVDAQGYLVDSSGAYVMGYPAVNGTIDTNSPLVPILISSGQMSAPQATTDMQLDMNLNASAALPTAATGAFTLTGNPSDGDTVTIGTTTYTFRTALTTTPSTVADEVLIGSTTADTLANLAGAIDAATTGGQAAGTTYSVGTVANASVTATATTSGVNLTANTVGTGGNSIPTTTTTANGSFTSTSLIGGTAGGTFSTPMTVYDSLGTSHVLTFNFTKTSSGTWSYQIAIPAADVGQTGDPVVVGSGTLQFDSSGNLVSPSANVTGISVPGLADGAADLNLTWQLYGSTGTSLVTQVAGSSATSTTQQDGYAAGTLQSYSINSDGTISGALSNGQTVSLGQIALATFPNSEGLTALGGNCFQAGMGSGLPSIGAPGSGGRGTLEGAALEQSNVDIAREFTQLIVAERGYQANAKAITTADNVIQTAISLVQ